MMIPALVCDLLGFNCQVCSTFLSWNEKDLESESEKAIVFRSLVATVKLHPAPDISLEAKVVKFLKSAQPKDEESVETFLRSLGQTIDKSSTDLAITSAAMEMFAYFFCNCSTQPRTKVYGHPRTANDWNPLGGDGILTLMIRGSVWCVDKAKAEDIHTCLIEGVNSSVLLATLCSLEIKDYYEQQAIHEMFFKRVLIPSEKYIWHLCVNRYSIIDGEQSLEFLFLLAHLLRISPSYQPTMEIVLHLPVVLTVPSCLSFFENDNSIWNFLAVTNIAQWEWNITRGKERQLWKTMHRILRMEGIDDANEETLQNNKEGMWGSSVVEKSMEWNTLQGTNVPEQE
ncbi:hypothetical protein BLNAU_11841 [Blattamonas nauphoetae]|uniref:Uncharacterized protein n=1 Tax=Blattamonas nauphoetae TaxID=2049346 RepID=A0ABQ9XS55_9EUKA|nr:hypothetical protein BLNAU_11841 [Blattamonas nauphoetae]